MVKEKSLTLNSPKLNRVELECLQMNADGLENAKISRILKLSVNEVELRLSDARMKLGAANRLHAIFLALRKGLIGVDP